jgi:hypothetical protein
MTVESWRDANGASIWMASNSGMLDRVGKAIEKAVRNPHFSNEDAARAAIEALRHPTLPMILAADKADTNHLVWKLMIEAALK